MTVPAKEKLTVEDIKRRRRVVCICKAIPLGRIEDAIRSGCTTVELVRAKTGAGGGDCQGRRCGPVVRELLAPQGSEAVQADGRDAELPGK